MRLFEVPDRTRVRLTSKLIRWIEHRTTRAVAENVVWEGITTDRYYYYKRARRRLIVDHTVDFFDEYGIWQRNTECEILDTPDNHTMCRLRNGGMLIDDEGEDQ